MWREKEKELLRLVLDELIPPGDDGRVPGAGTLGVADFLARADGHADDAVACVRRVLECVMRRSENFGALERDARVALLKQVEKEAGAAFATLVRLTYMGYYSRPDTRPLFGVGAHPVHPDGYPVPREDDALLQELTAPVRARGAFYRSP